MSRFINVHNYQYWIHVLVSCPTPWKVRHLSKCVHFIFNSNQILFKKCHNKNYNIVTQFKCRRELNLEKYFTCVVTVKLYFRVWSNFPRIVIGCRKVNAKLKYGLTICERNNWNFIFLGRGQKGLPVGH